MFIFVVQEHESRRLLEGGPDFGVLQGEVVSE